jgi:Icc protein
MVLLAQISDLHLRPRGLSALGRVETNTLARRAVDALLALAPRPDAVIVTGDIAERGDPREYEMAREILGGLPMPVYLIPGNHDDPAEMAAAFADRPWIKEGPGGAIQFAVDVGPVRLVCLDTHVPAAGHGRLGPERLAWAEAALAAAPERPTILALHHPPGATGITGMDAIMLRDGEALAAIVRRHRQVGRVIAGHVHRPIVASYGGTVLVTAPSVAHQVALALDTAAAATFTMEPPAFLLHRWSADAGFVTHTAYVERFPGPYDFSPAAGVTWPGY